MSTSRLPMFVRSISTTSQRAQRAARRTPRTQGGKEVKENPNPPRTFNRKGNEVIHRPRRETPVQLPSGHLEPPTWPPSKTYIKAQHSGQNRQPLHPLWQFFHIRPEAKRPLNRDSDTPPDMGSLPMIDQHRHDRGRAWTAPELRLKTFAELHTLWYMLLKEKNILATQAYERDRLGVPPGQLYMEHVSARGVRVRQGMARIKLVLQERRLGMIAAAGPHSTDAPRPPSHADPENTYDAIRDQVRYPDVRIPRYMRAAAAKMRVDLKKDKQRGVLIRAARAANGEAASEPIEKGKDARTGGKEQVQTAKRASAVKSAEVSESEVQARDEGIEETPQASEGRGGKRERLEAAA